MCWADLIPLLPLQQEDGLDSIIHHRLPQHALRDAWTENLGIVEICLKQTDWRSEEWRRMSHVRGQSSEAMLRRGDLLSSWRRTHDDSFAELGGGRDRKSRVSRVGCCCQLQRLVLENQSAVVSSRDPRPGKLFRLGCVDCRTPISLVTMQFTGRLTSCCLLVYLSLE